MFKILKRLAAAVLVSNFVLCSLTYANSTDSFWEGLLQTLKLENFSQKSSLTSTVKWEDPTWKNGSANYVANLKVDSVNKVDQSCGMNCKLDSQLNFDVKITAKESQADAVETQKSEIVITAPETSLVPETNSVETLPFTEATIKGSAEFMMIGKIFYAKVSALEVNLENPNEEALQFKAQMESSFTSMKDKWVKLDATTQSGFKLLRGEAQKLLKTSDSTDSTGATTWLDLLNQEIQEKISAAKPGEAKQTFKDIVHLIIDAGKEQGGVSADDVTLLNNMADSLFDANLTRHYELKRNNGTAYSMEMFDANKWMNWLKAFRLNTETPLTPEDEAIQKAGLSKFRLGFFYDVNDQGLMDEQGILFNLKGVDELQSFDLKTSQKIFKINQTKVPSAPSEALDLNSLLE